MDRRRQGNSYFRAAHTRDRGTVTSPPSSRDDLRRASPRFHKPSCLCTTEQSGLTRSGMVRAQGTACAIMGRQAMTIVTRAQPTRR